MLDLKIERTIQCKLSSNCKVFTFFSYYANQKKTLEVNPRHPLIKKLLDLVEKDSSDQSAKDLSRLLFETANMRSGYQLKVRETLRII